MKEYTIDIAYVCTVPVITRIKPEFENSEQGIIDALMHRNDIVMYSNKDHDEFTKLRQQLDRDGMIAIETRWWNGDVVLKSFKLNGKIFKPHDQFSCAAALHYTLTHK